MIAFLSVLIMAAVCSAIVEYDKRVKGNGFSNFNEDSEDAHLNAGAAC